MLGVFENMGNFVASHDKRVVCTNNPVERKMKKEYVKNDFLYSFFMIISRVSHLLGMLCWLMLLISVCGLDGIKAEYILSSVFIGCILAVCGYLFCVFSKLAEQNMTEARKRRNKYQNTIIKYRRCV